jgi:predicted DNA repair protein MutK
MFLVGGGIVSHGIPPLHHVIEAASHAVESIPLAAPVLGALLQSLAGVVIGAIVLAGVLLFQRIRGKGAH